MTDIVLTYPDCNVSFLSSIPVLMSYLKRHGVDVVYSESPVTAVRDLNPRFVGVSIPFSYMALKARHLILYLKHKFPLIKVIVGGVHPTVCPDDFRDIADYVCVGEGEQYLVDLIKDRDSSGCGFIDLDNVGLPDWDATGSKPFVTLPTGKKAVVYSGSRGCPFDCSFCSNHLISKKRVRYRSIDLFVSDVKELIDKYDTRVFEFRDETFTIHKKRVIDLCEKLKPLGIQFWCQTRVNLVDDEILGCMKQAGCIGLSFGIESGNSKVLEQINKCITLDEAEKGINLCKKHGLVTYCGFILGHPFDTVNSVDDTIRFADSLDPDYVGFSIMCPYPGSMAFDYVRKHGGLLTEDFSKYHTPNVVYQAPGLKGIDLHWLKDYAETFFYSKRLRQRYNQMVYRPGWKPKIHFLYLLFRFHLPFLFYKKDLKGVSTL